MIRLGRPYPLGLVVAILGCAVDQIQKWWTIYPFDIADRQPVSVGPFLDLVMVWNRGISYGLFAQDTAAGAWILLAIKAAAVVLLLVWLSRVETRLGAVAIGLIVGGAVGNAVDRLIYGAVADFFYLHAGGLSWYVFNLADVAIVVGVALLLYESVSGTRKQGAA